ncbi:hypothetical protein GCM10008905_14350 [Clostridium malenominatum]|uniref:HIT domain-containing protein n=1 Tax=Clostridium malenominatum TaxID=1539 RepID=A0ABP3U411_9CLOT
MTRKITTGDGRTIEVECLSCAITSGLIEPTGGVIIETKHFHAHQDIAYPISGLVIVASKRHIYSLDELTKDELIEYISLVQEIRRAQRRELGIEQVYYFYNEDTTHHFHLWMVPRYSWMNEFGRSVESLRPVLLHAKNKMNNKEHLHNVLESIELLRNALKNYRG